MLRLSLAEIISSGSSNVRDSEHVLVWNQDDLSYSNRLLEIEDVNAFLMAQDADELIRAIEPLGPLSTFDTMDNIHERVNLKQPDATLLMNECDLYPKALKRPKIAATKRAISRYARDVDNLMNEGSFAVDRFWRWVALHNIITLFVELISLSYDSTHPLTCAGFESNGHGMRRRISSHRMCVDTPPYSWLSELTWDSSDNSTYLCIPLAQNCERDTVDSVLSIVNRCLSPALCNEGGRMVLNTKAMNPLQRLWSVIASATFDLSPLLNKTSHGLHYILRCENCGRCVISSPRGVGKRFCSDSCRVAYNKKKNTKWTQLSQAEISVNGKGEAGADAPH